MRRRKRRKKMMMRETLMKKMIQNECRSWSWAKHNDYIYRESMVVHHILAMLSVLQHYQN
jgi:hypothetical protein